jgi:hypothetical protein
VSEIDIFRQFALTQADIELGQPATEQQIADFEACYNIKFPADIREYFLKINGVYQSGGFITLEALKDWCLFLSSSITTQNTFAESCRMWISIFDLVATTYLSGNGL